MFSASSHSDFPSQEASVSTAYSTASTTQARYPAGLPYNHTATTQQSGQHTYATTKDYQYQNGYPVDYSHGYSYKNGNQSQSASTYDVLSPSEPQESQLDDQGRQQYRQYYLPTTSYPPQDTPKYDPELDIDSVEDQQAGAWAGASRYPDQASEAPYSGYGDATSQAQQPSAVVRHTPQNPQTANVARTPTAQRWSREYSPEERMRVGLRRWETDQDRIDYERQQSQRRQRSQRRRRS